MALARQGIENSWKKFFACCHYFP